MNINTETGQVTAEIGFEKFPLWQGVRDRPGGQHFYPFRLKMDEKGFIRQRSSIEVEKKIIETYKDPGYIFPTSRPGSSSWGNWRGERYHSFIKKHFPLLEGKSVMEIGAGNLYMAERFIQENDVAKYLIVDPSVGDTSDDQRIRVIPTYFDEQFDPGDEQPDLIVSINCLEHVSDPFEFLVKTNQLLQSDEARAILVFPDIEAQFRRGDYSVLCFEHINYFSEASAKQLINQAGLTIVTCKTELDTLFYVLKRGEKQPQKTWSDIELFETAAEKFRNGFTPITTLIRKMQEEGKCIAFHGACNGLNTLFALNDISTKNILIFDGDENKDGMYIPSCSIPILPATSPRYREADLLIVSAMTFYEQIHAFATSQHDIPAKNIVPFCLTSENAENF